MVFWLDTREPISIRSPVAMMIGREHVREYEMPTADFVVWDSDGHAIAIERKTVSDLLGSLASMRLERQIERMATSYAPDDDQQTMLLVEGNYAINNKGCMVVKNRVTSWRHGAVQMALWSLQQRFGTHLLWTADTMATIDLLGTLHRRALKSCFHKHRVRPALRRVA